MRREARSGGGGDPEHVHQRLGAMVAGADRDPRIVQYGGGVVGMHPIDVETDDSGAVGGAVKRYAGDRRQGVAAFGNQRGLVRMDHIEAEAFDPADRCVKPDRADDMRSPGFEPRRRVEEGRSFERDSVDHRPAALPWRHLGEQLGASPQAADAGRAVKLVARKSVEIAADRGDIETQAGHRLAPVEQQQCALRMGDFGGAPGVEQRAEDVGNMGQSDDSVPIADHRFGGVEVDAAVGGQRDHIDCIARELPWDDIRMMFER